MKKLNELQLEQVSGGDRVITFCAGSTAASAISTVGAVALACVAY